jgi:hypothetical protein
MVTGSVVHQSVHRQGTRRLTPNCVARFSSRATARRGQADPGQQQAIGPPTCQTLPKGVGLPVASTRASAMNSACGAADVRHGFADRRRASPNPGRSRFQHGGIGLSVESTRSRFWWFASAGWEARRHNGPSPRFRPGAHGLRAGIVVWWIGAIAFDPDPPDGGARSGDRECAAGERFPHALETQPPAYPKLHGGIALLPSGASFSDAPIRSGKWMRLSRCYPRFSYRMAHRRLR